MKLIKLFILNICQKNKHSTQLHIVKFLKEIPGYTAILKKVVVLLFHNKTSYASNIIKILYSKIKIGSKRNTRKLLLVPLFFHYFE